MASLIEVIRRLTVVGRSEGVKELQRDLRDAAAAYNEAGAAAEQSGKKTEENSRRQLSALKSYEGLKSKLDESFRAQQQYDRAQMIADRALRQGIITQDEHGKVLDKARDKFRLVTDAQGNFAKQTSLTRWEMINLGRQFQDVAVGAASGQSAFLILTQQGIQMYDVFRSSEGTLGGFVKQVINGITPMKLLAGGIGLAGVGAVLAQQYWRNWALALDDVSKVAGTTANNLYRLQQAAQVRGGIGAADFNDTIKQVAAQVYLAKNGFGEMAETLRLNGLQARNFEESWESIAKLIARASGDMQKQQQLLSRMGLQGSPELIRFLESVSKNGLQATMDSFNGLDAGFAKLVERQREADQQWRSFWNNFGDWSKRAITGTLGWLDELIKKVPTLGNVGGGTAALEGIPADRSGDRLGTSGSMRRLARQQISQLSDPLPGNQASDFKQRFQGGLTDFTSQYWDNIISGARKAQQEIHGLEGVIKGALDPDEIRQSSQQWSTYVSALGEVAKADEVVEQTSRQLAVANLGLYKINDELQRQVKETVRIRQEEKRIQEGVQMGLFNEAKARQLDADAIALEKSRRDSNIKTMEDETRALIARTKASKDRADQAYIAGSPLEGLARLERESGRLDKQLDTMATSSLQGVSSALVDMGTGAKSAGQAFSDMGKAIERALMQMAINMIIIQPLAKSLQSTLGGFSGLFSTGPTAASSTTNAFGNAYGQQGLIPFANGGIVSSPTLFKFASGTGLMGEAGPEAIMPLRRGPGGRLGVETSGAAGMPTLNFVQNVSGAEASPPKISRGSGNSINIEQQVRGLVKSELEARGVRPRVGRQ